MEAVIRAADLSRGSTRRRISRRERIRQSHLIHQIRIGSHIRGRILLGIIPVLQDQVRILALARTHPAHLPDRYRRHLPGPIGRAIGDLPRSGVPQRQSPSEPQPQPFRRNARPLSSAGSPIEIAAVGGSSLVTMATQSSMSRSRIPVEQTINLEDGADEPCGGKEPWRGSPGFFGS